MRYVHIAFISHAKSNATLNSFQWLSLDTQTIHTAVYNWPLGSSVLIPGDRILSCQHLQPCLRDISSDQFE